MNRREFLKHIAAASVIAAANVGLEIDEPDLIPYPNGWIQFVYRYKDKVFSFYFKPIERGKVKELQITIDNKTFTVPCEGHLWGAQVESEENLTQER